MFHPGDPPRRINVTILEAVSQSVPRNDQACSGPVEYRGLMVEWCDGASLGVRAAEREKRVIVNIGDAPSVPDPFCSGPARFTLPKERRCDYE